MAAPLSYSLPAFRPDGWDRAAEWLSVLRDIGFAWVTLHPTFAVADEVPPRIHTDNAPLAAPVVAEARRLGMRVRMEPHLDWEGTFFGVYEWRRRMYVNPTGEYFDTVLGPLAELLPDELTLGSELDVSAYEFADQWLDVAEQLRPLGIVLGHKLNHDWDSAKGSVRNEANVERARAGLPPQTWFRYGSGLRRYLRELDYSAVSFYTPEPWRLDEDYVIGEFGLGSTDIERPWYFGPDRGFVTASDLVARRDWYLRFLKWLRGREGRAASFWTVAQFDTLGIMEPEWRDDAVVEAVRQYNQASP